MAAPEPIDVLRLALRKNPEVKWAVGVAGVGAAMAIIMAFFGTPKAALFATGGMLFLMVLLFSFAVLRTQGPENLKVPAMFLLWSVLILFVSAASLTMTSVFFHWPRPFEELVARSIEFVIPDNRDVRNPQDEQDYDIPEGELAGIDREGDLNPIEAQTMIDDVSLGRKIGPDGMIATEDQGDDFVPGETMYLNMNAADAPAGSVVKVVWYGPGEQKVDEQEKTVEAGSQYLAFQAADTASWQKGDYRAEVWIGDEKVNTQQFQIVDAGEAGQ